MAELLIPPSAARGCTARPATTPRASGGGRLLGAQVELTGMRAGGEEFPIELAVTRIEAPATCRCSRPSSATSRTASAPRRSCAAPAPASSRPATRPAAGWSATCTTAPSSGWCRCRCRCGWPDRCPSATRRRPTRSWGRPARSCHRRWRSCASWRGASTPRSSPTAACGPALEALATRAPVPVELLEVPDQPLPAPVEAAAYYVVAEALTNVAKYAKAKHATVRVDARGRHSARSRSPTTASAAPTRWAAPACAGWPTGSRRWTATLAVKSDGAGTRVSAVIPCE